VNFPRISQTPSMNFPWNFAHFKNSTVKSLIFVPLIRLVPNYHVLKFVGNACIDCLTNHGFRLAATVDEAVIVVCEATTAEICTVCFSSIDQEHLYCTDHSICGTISMEKRQVLLLQHCQNWLYNYIYGKSANLAVNSGWPLVWKTWKCRGFWQLSVNCRGFYSVREVSGKNHVDWRCCCSQLSLKTQRLNQKQCSKGLPLSLTHPERRRRHWCTEAAMTAWSSLAHSAFMRCLRSWRSVMHENITT